MSDVAFFGVILGVIGAAGLAGVGLGFYAAAKDFTAELEKVWDLGHQAGVSDITRATSLQKPIRPSDNPYRLRRPFLRRTKAGLPST